MEYSRREIKGARVEQVVEFRHSSEAPDYTQVLALVKSGWTYAPARYGARAMRRARATFQLPTRSYAEVGSKQVGWVARKKKRKENDYRMGLLAKRPPTKKRGIKGGGIVGPT